jgi:predicted nucleotidyltransferase
MKVKINIDEEAITAFCKRWKITECALFGSVLRDDFAPDSDIGVLVSFDSSAHWRLFDLVEMREELKKFFGREVDLIEKDGLRNPFRRHEILTTRQIIYAN